MQLSPSYSIEFNILYSYQSHFWSYIQGSVTIIAKKCHKSYIYYNTKKRLQQSFTLLISKSRLICTNLNYILGFNQFLIDT